LVFSSICWGNQILKLTSRKHIYTILRHNKHVVEHEQKSRGILTPNENRFKELTFNIPSITKKDAFDRIEVISISLFHLS